MGEPQTIHKTCVRVNSAEDDDESRDEVDHELPKKNPFVRVSNTLFMALRKVSLNFRLLYIQTVLV